MAGLTALKRLEPLSSVGQELLLIDRRLESIFLEGELNRRGSKQ